MGPLTSGAPWASTLRFPASVLALDACGGSGGVALGRIRVNGGAEGQVEILGTAQLAGRRFSSDLVPAIADLLSQAGMDLAELAAIVAVNGPGSFTGIRVSLGTLKGLAQPAGIPILAVSRLALLAHGSGSPRALTLLGAGRGDWFVGMFQQGRALWEKLMSDPEAAALLNEEHGATVCETGDPALLSGGVVCEALARRSPLYLPAPGAAGAIRCAVGRLLEGRLDDLADIDGNYLRPSDAERVRSSLPAGSLPAGSLSASATDRR